MLIALLFLLTITIAMGLILTSSPLNLGLWLLLLASIISVTLISSSPSWFGFILFLIYIGGLLVMFAYFVAISPNQQLSIMSIISMTIMSSSILTIPVAFSLPTLTTNIPSSQMTSISPLILLTPSSLPILSFLALILFFALVAVVKVSFRNQGPLRPFH